jgi:HK97 family phage major capsid protein
MAASLLSRAALAGLAAALAATYTMKEEIRALQSRVAAAAAAEAAAASAAPSSASGEMGGNGEGGGVAQQKDYVRKLKAVLKEREAELAQVTQQLTETRGQEGRFLAEVQLLQARIKKLSSNSVSRYLRLLAVGCALALADPVLL